MISSDAQGRVEHGDQILRRDAGLDVMHRGEDVTAARRELADVRFNFACYFFRCAEGQRLLAIE